MSGAAPNILDMHSLQWRFSSLDVFSDPMWTLKSDGKTLGGLQWGERMLKRSTFSKSFSLALRGLC